MRITSGRDKFVPGPFHLGRWAVPIGAVAVSWVAFIIVLLFFPSGQKTDAISMSELLLFKPFIRAVSLIGFHFDLSVIYRLRSGDHYGCVDLRLSVVDRLGTQMVYWSNRQCWRK